MAWRPNENLIDGELDNTVLGKVTGRLRFLGMSEPVELNLAGDFHRDIRGTKIRMRNPNPSDRNQNGSLGEVRAGSYMDGFSQVQTGEVGDITAGLPPRDYSDYPYLEWYSEQNGRVVLELDPAQVEVVGRPIPALESDPVSREKQGENVACFMQSLMQALPARNRSGKPGARRARR